jgi:hypothetical protein
MEGLPHLLTDDSVVITVTHVNGLVASSKVVFESELIAVTGREPAGRPLDIQWPRSPDPVIVYSSDMTENRLESHGGYRS